MSKLLDRARRLEHRDKEVRREYRRLKSLRKVGVMFGITAERVRQIVNGGKG